MGEFSGVARGRSRGEFETPKNRGLAGGGKRPDGALSKPSLADMKNGNVAVSTDRVSGPVRGGTHAGRARSGKPFNPKKQ